MSKNVNDHKRLLRLSRNLTQWAVAIAFHATTQFDIVEGKRMYRRVHVAISLTLVALTIVGRAAAQDCNSNGLNDACDIGCGVAGGPCNLPGCGRSSDCNGNGVPDECEFVATFQGLGDLPGGDFSSMAFGVSADGTTVVGKSNSASSGVGSEAFQWTRSWGMVGLGYLPDYHHSGAYDVSADGSVVVGTSDGRPFRWTMSTGMVGLSDWWLKSTPPAVSADGSIVVGGEYFFYSQCAPYQAFRWTVSEGQMGMGYLPGGASESVATGISADGSVVVGQSGPYGDPECLCLDCPCGPSDAFRWTDGGGMIGLGLPLDTCSSGGGANGVSADGSVVVGEAPFVGHHWRGAFRWTADGGIVALGDLPGGVLASSARAVSRDGSVVVGHGESDSGREAFIWDAQNGMRSLRALLVDEYGLDLTGWTLTSAEDISDDSRTIVGYGTNPDGLTEAWIATLPSEDADANGVPDECDVSTQTVPTMSVWGMAVTALLLLTAAKVSFRRRSATPRTT